jgi:hypothetical protein
MNEIFEKGPNKYGYINKARYLLWALLCQAMLNDNRLDYYLENSGSSLSLDYDYTSWITELATNRCRFLIRDIVESRIYADKVADGNFSFLRTNSVYKRCMESAYKKWRWVEKRLK